MQYTERFLSHFDDGSLASKAILSPGDIARRDANPGPSLDARIAESWSNPEASHVLSSLAAGAASGYAFVLAASMATGPIGGIVAGVVGGFFVARETYNFGTAVTGYRNYAYRRATGYNRPGHNFG